MLLNTAKILVISGNRTIRKGTGTFLFIKDIANYPVLVTNLHLLFSSNLKGEKLLVNDFSGNKYYLPFSSIIGFDYLNDLAVIKQNISLLPEFTRFRKNFKKSEDLYLYHNKKRKKLKFIRRRFIHHLNIMTIVAKGNLKPGHSGSGIFDINGKLAGIVKSRMSKKNSFNNIIIPSQAINSIYLSTNNDYSVSALLFIKAIENYKKKKYQIAERLFKEYIYQNPEDFKGYYHLGNLYNRIAIDEDLKGYYKKALKY